MSEVDNPSLSLRIFNALFFCTATISSLTWFAISLFNLITEINNRNPVIEFDKGAMYMFGVGMGLLFLSIGVVTRGVLLKKMSPKRESVLLKGTIIGMVIMIALPQIVHYSVNRIINRDNYFVCEAMSYRWVMYKKYVYTDSQGTCGSLVEGKETKKK